MTKNQQKVKMMVIIALFAAIIAILAQVTVPLPLVPITGQTLAIGLAATILGARYGTMSVVVYLALGAIGLPVFAQLSGGMSIVFGPTGGYLVGFIPTAFIIGGYLEKISYHFSHALIANIIGMFITLFIGTAWLKVITGIAWSAAFIGGFVPFILVGLLKATIAAWIGTTVRKRLLAANLLTFSTPEIKPSL